MVKILIMGSKEYPMGINRGYDLPSGGMEVYTENIVKHLKKDFDITIVSAWFPGAKRYEEIDGVKVYRVKRIPGRLIRGLTFPFMSFFKSLTLDFDIIIANGPMASLFSYILSNIKNKKYIAYPHGFTTRQKEIPSLVRRFISIFSEDVSFSRADALILVSDEEKKYFAKKLKNEKNQVLIKHGVDFERFSKIKKKKHKRKTILFLGRLLPVKGVEYLIKSLKYVREDYVCYIVGDGQDRERLEKIAREEKAEVIFTGFKYNPSEYVSMADVFVFPSLSEASGIVSLEMMSAKVPVISSDLGLYPKDTHIPVSLRSSEEIGKAINKVFSDEKIRNKIIKKGYAFSKKHSFEKVAKELKKVIEELARK